MTWGEISSFKVLLCIGLAVPILFICYVPSGWLSNIHVIFIPVRSDGCFTDLAINEVIREELKQDNKALIKYLQKKVLIPPSSQPYNLTKGNLTIYSKHNTERLQRYLFRGKRNGVFFEAGAYDGEYISNTLSLEKHYSWTGLLVEGSPKNQEALKLKHRKAWVAPVCLSTSQSPQKVSFIDAGTHSWIEGYRDDLRNSTYQCPGEQTLWYYPDISQANLQALRSYNCSLLETKLTHLTCFPLYSLLLSSGVTDIDYLSMDIEGAEMAVFQTLPFDKIRIKVLQVELQHYAEAWKMEEFLRSKGFRRLRHTNDRTKGLDIGMDLLFIRDGLPIPIY